MSRGVLPAGLESELEAAAPLAQRFHDEGFRFYFVGGVVRDHLLGVERSDQDLDATTDARPPDIKRLIVGLADAVWTQGERFGTIGCLIGGRPYEITTHRVDAYAEASRKPEVVFGDDIAGDLARRDFTVNAIAVDLDDHEIVDPHNGRGDLARAILRTPLDPEVSFSDDPLRMLRAARFHAAHGLVPVEPLTTAIVEMGDRMAIVSAERIRDEMQKLLLLEHAGDGLRLLHTTGLLGRVVAPLGSISAVDVERIARRVEGVGRDAAHRWAALLSTIDDGGDALDPLKPSGVLSRLVRWLLGDLLWFDEVPIDPELLRRTAATTPDGHLIEEHLDFIAAIRAADGGAALDVERCVETLANLREAEPDLDRPVPVLSGDEVCSLLGLEPGPDVGRAMDWLVDQRFVHGPLDPPRARERLVEWWPTRGLG